ncbi:MAG: Ig-like domain-containing protein, partial [candidate division WOR-3 bacterium]
MAKIELFIDNLLVSSTTSSTLSYLWNTNSFQDGLHQVKAKAYDTSLQTTEKIIGVYIKNSSQEEPPPVDNPPSIQFNLLSGTTISATISVQVMVTDDIAISSVTFYINNSLIGNYQGSFTYQLNTEQYPNGPISLKVIAVDSNGQSTTNEITLIINNVVGDNPPQVTIHYPYNNQVISGLLTISATAIDDKSVVNMLLYLNNNLLFTVSTNSIVYSINTAFYNNDTYSIKVIAYDDAGQMGFSEINVMFYNEFPLQEESQQESQQELQTSLIR